MSIHPSGAFAYVPNSNENTVSMYAINPDTGMLTALSTPTIATGNGPVSIIINPSGAFAYVNNNNDNSISMYAINASTGILTSLSTPTIATGNGPGIIAIK